MKFSLYVHAVSPIHVTGLITPQKIASWIQCPLKHFLIYEAGVIELPEIREDLGSVMHRAIAEYYRKLRDGNATDPEHELTMFLYRHDIVPDLHETVKRMIRNFTSFERERTVRYSTSLCPVMIEECIAVEPFMGIVDAVFRDMRNGRSYVIVDWKTGLLSPDGELRQEHVIQGLIYKYLIESTHGPARVIFIFLRYGKHVELPAKYDYTYLEKVLEQYLKGLESDRRERRRGKHCAWCRVRHICELLEKRMISLDTLLELL